MKREIPILALLLFISQPLAEGATSLKGTARINGTIQIRVAPNAPTLVWDYNPLILPGGTSQTIYLTNMGTTATGTLTVTLGPNPNFSIIDGCSTYSLLVAGFCGVMVSYGGTGGETVTLDVTDGTRSAATNNIQGDCVGC